jgi:hypothetical protein
VSRRPNPSDDGDPGGHDAKIFDGIAVVGDAGRGVHRLAVDSAPPFLNQVGQRCWPARCRPMAGEQGVGIAPMSAKLAGSRCGYLGGRDGPARF